MDRYIDRWIDRQTDRLINKQKIYRSIDWMDREIHC